MVGMELDRERIPSAYLLLEMSAPLDATLSTVKQHADDVLEEAKDLYAEEKNAQLVVETSEK